MSNQYKIVATVFIFSMLSFCFAISLHCSQKVNNHFEVRELHYQDKQEVEALSLLFADPEIQAQTGCKTVGWVVKKLDNYTEQDKATYGRYFICKSGASPQKVCGVLIGVYDAAENLAEFKAIAVSKDFRRQGIAQMLLEYAEKVYAASGVKTFIIGVFPDNKAAIACYKKAGFYISWEDWARTYCRIAYGKLLRRPTSAFGFYMQKNL